MGRVRETLHDVLRQTDAVLLALCVASTLYGMVLIASATSFRGTLKYVAVQGLGLLIGLALYFSSRASTYSSWRSNGSGCWASTSAFSCCCSRPSARREMATARGSV